MEKDIQTFSFRRKWLSDGIGDSYKTWYNKYDAKTNSGKLLSTPSMVLIKSPTGTGKTTFILKKLVPYAADKHRDILYFGNRIALNAQLKLAAANEEQLLEVRPKSGRELNEFEYNDFGNRITVMNYQSLDAYKKGYLRSLNPYYVIFDEAHFFIDDAIFNKKTYRNFRKLLSIYSDSALIFMTATPVDFEQIFDILVPKGINTHVQPEIYEAVSHKNIVKYENSYASKNYKLFAYRQKEEIIFKIKNAPQNEKWLIFVNSKRDGKEYLDKIKLLTDRKARLLTAENKNTSIWDILINENRFKSDILIVTRVIDSGVSINDLSVKHIVLPFCVESDFVQMLDRRRNAKNELLNVYCEDISIQKVCSKLNQVRMNCNILDMLIKKDAIGQENKELKKDLNEEIKNKLFSEKRRSFSNYVGLDSHGNLTYNPFAYYKLCILYSFYCTLKDNYKNNPDFYLRYIKKWLRTNKPINHIYSDGQNDFEAFLKHYIGRSITEEDATLFYEAFQYYYKRYCVKKFKRNSALLDKALNIRKGTTQRKATMNKSLKILNLPYEIKKEKGCWVLKKTE